MHAPGTLCKRALGDSATFSLRYVKSQCYDTMDDLELPTKLATSSVFVLPAHAFDVTMQGVGPQVGINTQSCVWQNKKSYKSTRDFS